MRYGLSSSKRDNLHAISYFRCGVVHVQAQTLMHYKFQTKYTSYCPRKQTSLFVEARKTEPRARQHNGHVAHFVLQIMLLNQINASKATCVE